MTNLPEYCNFYKHLLVEDVTLAPVLRLHYGKCSIIGLLIHGDDNKYYLENVQFSINKNKIPYKKLSVLLLAAGYDRLLPNNNYVEVFGEVVLSRNNEYSMQQIGTSTKELLEDLKTHFDGTFDAEKMCKNNYSPAIQIHDLVIVNKPRELLEIRTRSSCAREEYEENLNRNRHT